MKENLAEKLDNYLENKSRVKPSVPCLEDDEDGRRIDELLAMARSIVGMPKEEPSPRFRETARGRLMARLGREKNSDRTVGKKQVTIIDRYSGFWGRLWQPVAGFARVAVPITLIVLVAAVMGITSSNLQHIPGAYASECTLSILSGSVDVSGQTGTDGMTLSAGTRVRASEGAHAILTFFDGSTVTLEPGADVEIKQADTNDEQGVTIILKQWAGRTWSRVVKMADAGSRYEIETPTATAIVRGTLFTTEVDEQGKTTVATTQGLVSVAALGEEVYLPPQQRTSVNAGEPPALPETSPEPDSRITVRIGPGAVGSIVGPGGTSTGNMEGGISFNQIPGSESDVLEDGSQEITIPEPAGGEYKLVLRFTDGETVSFNIAGTSGGQEVFSYGDEYGSEGEDGYIVRFNLKARDGQLTGGEVNSTGPLRGEQPERVVMPDPARNAKALAKKAGQSDDTLALSGIESSGNIKNNNGNNVNDNAGRSGEAPGQTGETPGQSGNTPGQSGTAPGQTGDTPGQSGSAPGQTDNAPGQSGNTPGQTGNTPGQSGTAPGQTGDTPGQSGSAPGQTGDTPGQSGSAPGQTGDTPGQSGEPPATEQNEDEDEDKDKDKDKDKDQDEDDDDQDGNDDESSGLLDGVYDLLGGLLGLDD